MTAAWPHPDDVPTPAQVLAAARALLSPRAAAGLDALPEPRRGRTAHCIVAMRREGMPLDTRHLEKGQAWPDVIEWTPTV